MAEPAAADMITYRMMTARPRTTSQISNTGGGGLSPVAWSYQDYFTYGGSVGQISLSSTKLTSHGQLAAAIRFWRHLAVLVD